MFGYLNLGNPKLIGNTESQEAVNCRVDRGFIEFVQWDTSDNPARNADVGAIITGGKVRRLYAHPSDNPAIVWDYNAVVGDALGMAAPTSLPTITMETGGQPYPVGTYKYAFTLYNSVTGEESAPTISADVVVGANEYTKFDSFYDYSATYPKKAGLSLKIYRRPIGSSEFLYAMSVSNGWATHAYDAVADDSLGSACDSIDDIVKAQATSIAWFSGKLWIAYGKNLWFSRTDMPWAFRDEFQKAFGSSITGLYSFGETMVITLSSGKSQVVYGNDETDFSFKEMDAEFGLALNGGRVVSGALLMPSMSNQTIVITPDSKEYVIDGITVFDGTRPITISNNIRSIFPRLSYFVNETQEPQTGIVENRFYILKMNATVLPVETPTMALFTSDMIGVIYDLHAKGFLMGDDTQTFRYRTKEFSTPPKAKQLRRLFVETSGQVTVEVYLNGLLATTRSFSNSSKRVDWFPTKPWQADSFSFRFIGQPGAQVYSFGVVDPVMEVGG